jgi:hypothetical protein
MTRKKRNVTVIVGTGTVKEFFGRAHEDAKKLDRGELLSTGMRLTFEDPMSEAGFFLANLGSQTTGLSFVVWIGIGSGFQHDVYVWISKTLKPDWSELVSVAIRPEVHVVEGNLSASDLAVLKNWVELNREVLVKYWDGDIVYTEEAINAIRQI